MSLLPRPKESHMAGIEFIGGEKGGVGKSVLARVIAQYCIDKGQPLIGFDTDRSHSTFLRFYGDFASKVVIDDFASLDRIAEAITAVPERRVLVDLAAQTMPPLKRWLDDSGVLPLLAGEHVPVRFWHVMDDGVDSISLLDRLLMSFGGTVSYVVVLNHGRGSDFAHFHASPTKALAIEHGAKILDLRALHDTSMHKIDKHDASFWAAINHRGDDKALGLLERQRVKMWLSRTYEDLDRILA